MLQEVPLPFPGSLLQNAPVLILIETDATGDIQNLLYTSKHLQT